VFRGADLVNFLECAGVARALSG